MIDKQEIVRYLKHDQIAKVSELTKYIADLSHSLTSEQKSTAGDKHETGRAMIHLEIEKAQHQLYAINQMKAQLERIHVTESSNQATFGSMIIAERDLFLLGIGLGKQVVNGKIVYCVGMDAPIAKGMIGKVKGDDVFFNGSTQLIVEIV